MRIVLNTKQCEGNAVCVGIAPEVFDLPDDVDVVNVLIDEPDEPLWPRVREAVRNCPRQALSIEED
jgi:ferredoxin